MLQQKKSNQNLPEKYTRLCDAIKKKDEETARQLLLNDAEVNIKLQSKQNTPLHLAILMFEDTEIIQLLLDKKANVLTLNRNNQTPIDLAVIRNKEDAIKLLLKKAVLSDNNLTSSMYEATKNANETIVKLLIDYAVERNSKYPSRKTLSLNLKSSLDLALAKGCSKIVESIIPYCELKKIDQRIPKDILLKSEPQHIKCVNILLKYGFTIDFSHAKNSVFVCSAVENDYTTIVEKLLDRGINANMVNKTTKFSLLHSACFNKNFEIADMLIKHGADVNSTVGEKKWLLKDRKMHRKIVLLSGKTSLYIAVDNMDVKITKLLIDNGANLTNAWIYAKTAVQKNCKEIIEIFLDCGVNINEVDNLGNTLLHYCTSGRNSSDNSAKNDIAELLLKKGANVNIKNTYGETPVFNAVQNTYIEITKKLLKHSGDIEHKNNYGDTLLHKASENIMNLPIIEILLSRNASVDVINNRGQTSLHIACNRNEGNVQIVQKLLEAKADVNCVDKFQKTPLHYACDVNATDIVQILLEHNSNVNVTNSDGNTPLHSACEKNNAEIIEKLLSKNADVNAKNNCGETSLHILCNNKHSIESDLETVELLLQYQADPNIEDRRGKTPLFKACSEQNVTLAKLLLDNKANVNHMDIEGKTPIFIAVQNYYVKLTIIKLLLEYKANVHINDENGSSLLHNIASKNRFEVITDLIKLNLDVNIVNNTGLTALHIAAKEGHKETVNNLLKHKADINILNNFRKTALHYAFYGLHKQRKELRKYRQDPTDFYGNILPSDYEDDNIISYKDEIHTFKEIIKILKQHIIKLKCAGLDVHQFNNYLAYNDDGDDSSDEENEEDDDLKIDPYQFESECLAEIEEMETTNINKTNISLHKLFTDNIHQIARYAKNINIIEFLKSDLYREEFPIYIDMIKHRVEEAFNRSNFMDKIQKYSFSSYLRLPHNCVDEIISYLDNKDLMTFIEAIEPFVNSNKPEPSQEGSTTCELSNTTDNHSYKKQKTSENHN